MTNHENLVDTKSTALTDMIFYNTSATTGEVANTEYADNTRNYKVVFHFLVSYAQLNTTASEINQIAIYGKNETVNDNYCAVFYFLNDDGTALAPISTSG